MSTTVGKVIAVVCGILLATGIVCCFLVKSSDLISTVVIFALIYVAYLFVLSKKMRREATETKKSPLKRK